MSEPVSLTTLASGHAAVDATARSGTAVSPVALAIRKSAYAVIVSAEQSIALFGARAAAISELWTLAAEHAEAGWDGDDAQPISRDAWNLAVSLTRALPSDVPMPEFAAEPDGSISLDWGQSRNRLISISIGTSDRLAYAWLNGTDRGREVVRFDGFRMPSRLHAAIREIVLPNGSVRVD